MLTLPQLQEIYAKTKDEIQRHWEEAVRAEATELEQRVDVMVANVLRAEVRQHLRFEVEYEAHPCDEWRPGERALRSWEVLATPTNLPEGMTVRLGVRFTAGAWRAPDVLLGDGVAHPDVLVLFDREARNPRGGYVEQSFGAAQSADEQLSALAVLLCPIAKRRSDEQEREQKAANQKAQTARAHEGYWRAEELRHVREREHRAAFAQLVGSTRARLEARLPELQRALEARRDADLANLGWPDGAVLALYRIGWLAGVSSEGWEVSRDWYSAAPRPDEAGWWRVLEDGEVRRVRVESPNGYSVQQVVATRVEELPRGWMWRVEHYQDGLSEEVVCDGLCHVQTTAVHVALDKPALLLNPLIAGLIRRDPGILGLVGAGG